MLFRSAYAITGGGAYCGQGGTGSPVGLANSETGVDYTLYLDGTPTTTIVAGTGSAISFGDQLTAGDYTVLGARSEERRVGKECRYRWWPDH